MLIISQPTDKANAMFSSHDAKFTESQLLRVQAVASYKAAGDALIEVRKLLASATKTNPVETDLGTFTSFDDYLRSGAVKVSRASAYSSIELAENWDIVLTLGMQDCTDERTLRNSMRVSRTLKIIKWYKEKLAEGYGIEELTLERYWEEQEGHKSSGPTKSQLLRQIEDLQEELAFKDRRIAELESKLCLAV